LKPELASVLGTHPRIRLVGRENEGDLEGVPADAEESLYFLGFKFSGFFFALRDAEYQSEKHHFQLLSFPPCIDENGTGKGGISFSFL